MERRAHSSAAVKLRSRRVCSSRSLFVKRSHGDFFHLLFSEAMLAEAAVCAMLHQAANAEA